MAEINSMQNPAQINQNAQQVPLNPGSLKPIPKISFLAGFGIIFGLSVLSLIITSMIMFTVSFSGLTIVGYVLIFFQALVLGWLLYHIYKKKNKGIFGALLGVFTPLPSLFLILSLLILEEVMEASLSALEATGEMVGMGSIARIFSSGMDPLITGVIFYVLCNIFLLIALIKNKEYKSLLWYFLAPLLFIGLWFLAIFLTSPGLGNL